MASHQWGAHFSSFVMFEGFTQSKVDYSLLYKGHYISYVIVIVYVEDIVPTGVLHQELSMVKV